MLNGKWQMEMRISIHIFHLPFSICHHYFFLAGAAALAPAAGAAPFAPAAGAAPLAPAAGAAPLPAGAAAPAAGAAPAAAAPSTGSSFTALTASILRCATFGRPYTLLASVHFSC